MKILNIEKAIANYVITFLDVIPPNQPPLSNSGGIKACICMGFPIYTLDGSRGEPDDPLLDMRSP